MKKIASMAALAFTCMVLTLPAQAAEPAKMAPKEPAKMTSKYDTYTCEDLTSLGYEFVGPVVYYVKGHYDAKHDIWTDYGPKSKSETADEEIAFVPVENVYAYCLQNPKETVVNALAKSKKTKK